MKLKAWEFILIVLLVLALALWAFLPRQGGNTVTVSINGQQTASYPLNQNLRQAVDGYGGFSLTLVISDGAAHVENSTCPDLICQHHSPVSKAGEQIVCLPGRIVLTVTGEGAEIDAVTQ